MIAMVDRARMAVLHKAGPKSQRCRREWPFGDNFSWYRSLKRSHPHPSQLHVPL